MSYLSFCPVGTVLPFAGASAPVGWLMADGSGISQTTYSALYSVISLTWGNPGGGLFSLPDLRGVYPKGAGTTNRAAGKDANGNFYSATHTAHTTDRMQGHRHIYFQGAIADRAAGGSGGYAAGNTTPTEGYVLDPSFNGSHGTPRTGVTTEPQNVGINYIIKY